MYFYLWNPNGITYIFRIIWGFSANQQKWIPDLDFKGQKALNSILFIRKIHAIRNIQGKYNLECRANKEMSKTSVMKVFSKDR